MVVVLRIFLLHRSMRLLIQYSRQTFHYEFQFENENEIEDVVKRLRVVK